MDNAATTMQKPKEVIEAVVNAMTHNHLCVLFHRLLHRFIVNSAFLIAWKGSGVDSYNKQHPQEMPAALEAGTLNGHGIAGLGAALEYIERTGPKRLLCPVKHRMSMCIFCTSIGNAPAVCEASTINSIERTGMDVIRETQQKYMRRFYEGVKELFVIAIYAAAPAL